MYTRLLTPSILMLNLCEICPLIGEYCDGEILQEHIAHLVWESDVLYAVQSPIHQFSEWYIVRKFTQITRFDTTSGRGFADLWLEPGFPCLFYTGTIHYIYNAGNKFNWIKFGSSSANKLFIISLIISFPIKAYIYICWSSVASLEQFGLHRVSERHVLG